VSTEEFTSAQKHCTTIDPKDSIVTNTKGMIMEGWETNATLMGTVGYPAEWTVGIGDSIRQPDGGMK